jgi:hypothetical protein
MPSGVRRGERHLSLSYVGHGNSGTALTALPIEEFGSVFSLVWGAARIV